MNVLASLKFFAIYPWIKPITVLAVRFGSLSWRMLKFLLIKLNAFLCKLSDWMLLQTSELILMLTSWLTSSIKINEPVSEAVTRASSCPRTLNKLSLYVFFNLALWFLMLMSGLYLVLLHLYFWFLETFTPTLWW